MNLRGVVEPIHPFERCVYDAVEAAPRAATVDDVGFETVIDRLSQRIVITVADAAHRGFDACIGETFAVFDRQILAASVAVTNKPRIHFLAAFLDRLFKGIQHETRMRRWADTPTYDLAGVGIDDKSHITKPILGRNIGEILHPQSIGCADANLAVHQRRFSFGKRRRPASMRTSCRGSWSWHAYPG